MDSRLENVRLNEQGDWTAKSAHNPASRKPGSTGPIVESNLWDRKPCTGEEATSLESLVRIHRRASGWAPTGAVLQCAIRLPAALCVQPLIRCRFGPARRRCFFRTGRGNVMGSNGNFMRPVAMIVTGPIKVAALATLCVPRQIPLHLLRLDCEFGRVPIRRNLFAPDANISRGPAVRQELF
jgi:hypothetical protein